tara:strand:+ start:1227 stop:1958 length:732 start_codon:yes stop_codon:yes gene_type:complete
MPAGQGGRHYERMLVAKINYFALKNGLNLQCSDPAGANKNEKDIKITGAKSLTVEVKNTIGMRAEFGQFQTKWADGEWKLSKNVNSDLTKRIFGAVVSKLPPVEGYDALGFTNLDFEIADNLRIAWLGSGFEDGKYGGFDIIDVDTSEIGLSAAEIIEEYYAGNDAIQIDGYGLYGLSDKIPTSFSDAEPWVKIKFRVKYHGGFKKGNPRYSFTVAPFVEDLAASDLDLECEETLTQIFMEQT